MSEIITLSSDEDELTSPPKKRIKPSPVNNNSKISDIVILSESESEDNATDCKDTDDIKHNNELYQTFIPKNNCESNIPTEDNSEKENSPQQDQPNTNNTTEHHQSTSSISDVHSALTEFLNICEESTKNSVFEIKTKFPNVMKLYVKCGTHHAESFSFKKILDDCTKRARSSASQAVIALDDVYEYLNSVADTQSIEVPEEDRKKLKKLEKTIRLLLLRIKHLEETEIDDEDEENSSYIQLDRFINRLNKVHLKYCQLLKKNPYSGRITYAKLGFVDSEYNEINRAINKKYKNNSKFPSYIEIETYIRKCIADNNLGLSESIIKSESQHCFKKLGELLQSRRKKELYDVHYMYIKDFEDPANKDPELDSVLKKNFVEATNKIDKLYDHFVARQEVGEEAKVSNDESDNSNYVDSEAENDKN